MTPTRLAGRADDDLLIVGAGLGTTVETLWGAAARVLGDRFEVVGLDLPGHGHSPPVGEPFTVDDLAAAVMVLAQERATSGRRCWYAGVSLAGAIAFTLGLRPGTFGGVVAVAAASSFGAPDAWHERAALVRRDGTQAMVAGSRERWFAPGFVARDPVAEQMLDELVEVDDVSYALCCEALASYDVCADLAEIATPFLIVPGAHDIVVPPDRAAEDVEAIGARMRVADGCGHQPPIEAPEGIADIVLSFVDQSAPTFGAAGRQP